MPAHAVTASDARRTTRLIGVSDIRLYLNNLPDYDWLIALEFGRIDDGQPSENWRAVSDTIGILLDAPGGREVGFKIVNFSTFDEDARDLDEVWSGPRFHVPQLGLTDATIGETVLAARALFGTEPTINRVYFSAGVNASGEASKSGVAPGDALALALAVAALPRLRLRGIMGIPEPTDDIERRRAQFRTLRGCLEACRAAGLAVDTLSMGMSADLEDAIAEGATLVRVGTAIFGPRGGQAH